MSKKTQGITWSCFTIILSAMFAFLTTNSHIGMDLWFFFASSTSGFGGFIGLIYSIAEL